MDQNSAPADDQINPNIPTTSSGTNQAVGELLELENLIKEYVSNLEKVKGELTIQKEMFEDIFLNDQTYQEHDKNFKEANKIKSQTKQQILKQPSVAVLSEKIKDMRLEIKGIQEALSDYLQKYQKLTGSTQFELEDGQVMQIVNNSKLVKKT